MGLVELMVYEVILSQEDTREKVLIRCLIVFTIIAKEVVKKGKIWYIVEDLDTQQAMKPLWLHAYRK